MNRNVFQCLGKTVQVWWFELDRLLSCIERYYQILSKDEKEKAGRYKTQLLRARHIVSLALLKILISNYTYVRPEEVKINSNKYGKPELFSELNHSALYFNMSHSGSVGVFAFAQNYPIGVDVEEVKDLLNLKDIIEICLSDYEKSWFASIPADMQTSVFYKTWTAKEAFLKAIGTGLSSPMTGVEFSLKSIDELQLYRVRGRSKTSAKWQLHSFETLPNYAGSLITEHCDAVVRTFHDVTSFVYA